MNEAAPDLLPIGWKERIDFPAWGLRSVKAKIDTGARTSALNVCDFELIERPNGQPVARFRPVVDRKRNAVCGAIVEVQVERMVKVRSSSGEEQLRPEIETEIRLGPIVKRIRLTLTDRSRMLFAVILGRTALAETFVVDVTRKYVQRQGKSRDGRPGTL